LATTLFSEEQLEPLSKVFERMTLSATSSMHAVVSTYVVALPVPTPIVGVPEE